MRHRTPRRPRASPFATACALTPLLVLGGCAAFPQLSVHPDKPRTMDELLAETPSAGAAATSASPLHGHSDVITLPGAATPPGRPNPPAASLAQIAAIVPDTSIDASLPPQPLPQFLDTVFGDLLHVPYSLGPDIGARKEIITLRSAPRMSRRDFFALVQSALRDYGLVVAIENGAVSVQESGAVPSGRSLFLRSRSAADTPDTSRTVVQFVQLYAVESGSIQGLVQDLFPAAHAVKLTPSQQGNFVTVSGSGRDVAAAVAMIAELDQPRFAGAQVARIEPVFFTAADFAKALSDALTTEGFIVSNSPGIQRGVMILPLPGSANQVLAFAGDAAVMARVQFWAAELDKPAIVGDKTASFVYNVRNTDASSLGALARGQTPTPYSPTSPVGVPGTSATNTNGPSQTPAAVSTAVPNVGGSGQIPGGGTIVVDAIGNRILFTGTAAQFAQVRNLLQQLDVAPRQVLIEVTVAEVTLSDATNVGLNWFFQQNGVSAQSTSAVIGVAGSSQPAGGGLSLSYNTLRIPGLGSLQTQFNAFASNNNVNIISRPRIVAKSGGEAQIQVGTDIPIISSQAAAGGVQTSGTTQVLQSVQYRQTGVILRVKPTIYGDDRVNIEVSQEVSNSLPSSASGIDSPQIQDRSLSTELSLQDGATAVLGGLISNSYTKANGGVPFLKDIPILGTAFRNDTLGGSRDELVMLITPHILVDSEEMSAVADTLTGEMNKAFRVGTGASYTLSPFRSGMNLGAGPPARPTPPDLDRAVRRARERARETEPTRASSSPDLPPQGGPAASPL